MGKVIEIADSTFQSEVLDSRQPVLVDFWAPACPPCRLIAPMIEELAAENSGSIKVTKVNVHDNLEAAQRYGIQAIPTLMIFKDGEVVERMVGAQPKSWLQKALDEAKD